MQETLPVRGHGLRVHDVPAQTGADIGRDVGLPNGITGDKAPGLSVGADAQQKGPAVGRERRARTGETLEVDDA